MSNVSFDKEVAQNLLQNPKNLSLIIDEIYSSVAEVQPQVGDICWTMRTLAQQNASAVGEWVACDGGDVTGSAYETLTGDTTVPDTSLLITIGNVFVRIN